MASEKLNDSGEPPSIEKAWDFYNTYTLPRRVLKEGQTDDFRKLEPGEVVEGSDIYSVWSTSVDEIGDFGLGIVLYFKMLIILIGVMIVCLCLNGKSMAYYGSDDYSMKQPTVVAWQLKLGSTVCDWQKPVCTSFGTPCTCTVQAFDADTSIAADGTITGAFSQLYSEGSIVTGEGCKIKNLCTLDFKDAWFDIGMLFFLVIGLFALAKAQNKIVEEADEAEQTAQDYSICVADPNDDATDPDEWQQFFSQFGHVSYVTVAIDNGDLITKLAERRLVARKIAFETATPSERAHMFDPSENDSAFDGLSWTKKKLGSALPILRRKIATLDEEITELCKKEYKAVKVFVVFETEAAQRACLREMTVGTIPALMDKAGNIPEHQCFRRTNVLVVHEAPEPTDVIWYQLEYGIEHLLKQTAISLSLVGILVGVACALIVVISKKSAATAALFVACANGALPAFLKMINETEEHHTQGNRQTSLLLKLVLARWTTAGFIIWAINPFEDTIREVFLAKVAKILFADALTTPVIRLVDPAGRLARHFSAKSAKTQEKMNSFFTNTAWFLAERYTDMTKSLFVGLMFSTLFPGGLFFTMMAFFVCYWVDKYCLFRLWKQPPAIDASLTAASRLQIAIVLIVHGVIANAFYSGFPFDNLIATGQSQSITVNVLNFEDDQTTASTATFADEVFLKFDMKETTRGDDFNVKTSLWMTDDQKDIVKAYSIINILLLVLILVGYFGRTAAFSVYKLFYGEYIPTGDPNPDLYSFVPGIESYIPQHQTDALPLPLICCDMSDLDSEHISFTLDNYDTVNITKDAPIEAAKKAGIDTSKCFSRCKQYKSPELLASEAGKGN